MKVIISKQHSPLSQQIEDYATLKISKLSKYNPRILEITAHLITEVAHRGADDDYHCELEIKIPGNDLTIRDSERSMDKAIDKCVERAKRLIVKTKEKTISKKHKEGERARNKV